MESFKNLTRAVQLLLSVSSLSLLVTHYSSLLQVLVSLSGQFSGYFVDKNMVFLVCNGIILCVSVLPGSISSLSANDGQKLGEIEEDVGGLQPAVSSSSEEVVEVGLEVGLLQEQIHDVGLEVGLLQEQAHEVGLEVELLQEQVQEEEQEELQEEEEDDGEGDGDNGEEEVEGELVNEDEEESDERFENFIRKMREQMGFVPQKVVLAQV